MPRLIVKWLPYFKAGAASKHAPNLVRYIATRDGVDFITDANRTRPATLKQMDVNEHERQFMCSSTQSQRDLIERILRDYPDTKELFELEDYERQPTAGNASEFITQAMERHLHESGDKGYYIKYIAERPCVEDVNEHERQFMCSSTGLRSKQGSHGLFTAAGEDVVLARVQREVAEHIGNIWTPIISLRREDAVRLSYDSGRQWQALLRSQAANLANHFKIHPDNFRWYAAFHNQTHHPHVHLVCWSSNPREGFLTEEAAVKMKSDLARRIFRQDLQHIYEQQTDRRGQLNTRSLETMREMCVQIKSGTCGTPELGTLILQLSERLAKTSGKKVYGFLKPDVKGIVDRIVDGLAADKRVADCYDAWYGLREEILRTYQNEMPPRVPLSVQKEFKQIKNMVIAEAMNLGGADFYERFGQENLPGVMHGQDGDALPDLDSAPDGGPDEEPVVLEMHIDEDTPPADDTPAVDDSPEPEILPDAPVAPHVRWTPRYKQARAFLFGSATEQSDFDKAFELFLAEASTGSAFAMHDLGIMYAAGHGRDVGADAAHEWYAKALAGFIRIESAMEPDDGKVAYLRYRVGKMYMAGLGTEQDYTQAASWLRKAVDDNHKYAQYSLASFYYRGHGVEQDYAAAFKLYDLSAEQDNAYASYELAKMHRDGVGTQADAAEAARCFEDAYRGFVVMEMKSSDDKLLYRIGQMLRDGVGVEANPNEAEYYFGRSAQFGNAHAQYALAKMYLKSGNEAKISTAVELLRKSAESDNPTAQYALGKLYRDGEHMEKDIARAVELFTKAAEQKNGYAAYALGKLYLDGTDVPKDVAAALRWLMESEEQRNQFAQYRLGKLYCNGVDVPKDISAALRWFSESAEQGNEFAQYRLGKLYCDGVDVPKDIPAALRWFSESAEQGNEFAQYQLGKLYIMGKNVERDRDEALRWFTMAAEQGNEYAQFFIDRIDEIGNTNLLMATTRLFRELGRIFEQQHRQLGAQAGHIDRKRMQILREKKIAQGHARDDYEQEHGIGG